MFTVAFSLDHVHGRHQIPTASYSGKRRRKTKYHSIRAPDELGLWSQSACSTCKTGPPLHHLRGLLRRSETHNSSPRSPSQHRLRHHIGSHLQQAASSYPRPSMVRSVASGSASPSGERPSTGDKSTPRRESDAGPSGVDGPKDSKAWTEGDFAYEYVQIAQVSHILLRGRTKNRCRSTALWWI